MRSDGIGDVVRNGAVVLTQKASELEDPQGKSNRAFGSDRVARSVWYRAYDLRYEEALVDRYFVRGRRVLDLGCGYGRTTVSLKRRGYAVVGADIVERMIAEARAAHPDIDYRVMDACAIEFAEATFDYVLFSFNGIDCILPECRRLQAMKEIFRVLKPGGTAILSSHNWLPYLLLPQYWKSGRIVSFLCDGVLARRWYSAGVEDMPFDCYISTPLRTLQQLRATGFDRLEVAAGQHPIPWPFHKAGFLTMCIDLWPHFIARKRPACRTTGGRESDRYTDG
jgi:SAM-dependent methyltransferase